MTATAVGMQATVARGALLEGLRFVAPLALKNSSLPILKHVLLEPVEGGLRIACTDMDRWAETVVAGDVEGDGGITVPAAKLLALTLGAPDGPVSLALGKNDLTVRAGGRFRLAGLPVEEFPSPPEFDFEDAWDLPRDLLARVVREVAFAVSDDESRPAFGNVFRDQKDGRIRWTATNGHRVGRITLPAPRGKKSADLLFPAGSLEAAATLPGDGPLEVAHSRGYVGFRCGVAQVRCRLVEGSFPNVDQVIPNVDQVIPSEFRWTAVVERSALLSAVKRVMVTARDGDFRLVVLDLDEGGCRVSTENADVGDAEIPVPLVSYEGEPLKIGFTVTYLAEMLGLVPHERVRLHMTGPERPVLMLPDVDEHDGLMVLMPLRIIG